MFELQNLLWLLVQWICTNFKNVVKFANFLKTNFKAGSHELSICADKRTRQIDRQRYSMCNNRPHLASAMRPNNKTYSAMMFQDAVEFPSIQALCRSSDRLVWPSVFPIVRLFPLTSLRGFVLRNCIYLGRELAKLRVGDPPPSALPTTVQSKYPG